jgi:DNA excision repair protein ERCC-2
VNCDKVEVKLSVRKLIEFILRSGDLNNKFKSSVRAVEGTKVHQKLQRQYKLQAEKKKDIEKYESEVFLNYEIEYKEFKFVIDGRIDGVITKKNFTIIDEIKTVAVPLEFISENYNPLHFKQAECYGYIYAMQNNLKYIIIQLTYYNINDHSTKFIKREFELEDLEKIFMDVLKKYYKWVKFKVEWYVKRNLSIKNMKFPFKNYRKGQRNIAVAVYNTIRNGKRLFIQAPTGIGKTISTIFPSLKAISQGLTSKIFYLTAKTITSSAAEDTIKTMLRLGLRLKVMVLTAKEKLCFKESVNCNPEECEFAKGHYDRVNEAIFSIINDNDFITRDIILKYSHEFKVCPFEFSLDIALICDLVICDYNYAFDPLVYLRRFFDEGAKDYVFLIDEAHNLVDRSRDMFSAEIYKKDFLNVKSCFNQDKKLLKNLNKINTYMLKLKREFKNSFSNVPSEDLIYSKGNICVRKEKFIKLCGMMRSLSLNLEEWIIKNNSHKDYEDVVDLYFKINSFIKIAEFYDENFVTYIENIEKDIKIKILCLDSSHLLDKSMKRAKASILFSATLSPMKYYKEVLGGSKEDYNITMQSPFESKNRELLIARNISTIYKDREKSIIPIIKYINEVVNCKKGNYIVFFPSYQYMNKVYEIFTKLYPNVRTTIQKLGMDEEEKQEFMSNFKENIKDVFVAFAVLGGMFSEGIDLKGKKLIGTIIVGVGIPGICVERDVMKNHFKKKNSFGYEYAYMYPGMNKILQAAGRVIRTENDRGVILLIDRRFVTQSYKKLFPREWYPNHIVDSTKDVKNILYKFWNEL